MKRGPVSVYLTAIAAPLVGCKPPPKLPITGEIKLEFVGKTAEDIYFKLKNQSSGRVAFWGARDWWWEGVFPQGPRFECVLADLEEMHETPFPLIDGAAWEEFVIEPSEGINIVVSNFYLRDSDGRLPTGGCRLVLQLDGDAIVKSEEFESTSAWSQH